MADGITEVRARLRSNLLALENRDLELQAQHSARFLIDGLKNQAQVQVVFRDLFQGAPRAGGGWLSSENGQVSSHRRT